MSYRLEGTLLEVCTCNVLCPCWVGEDPDGDGYCDAVFAWHIDRGTIDGVDVSDRTMSLINHIPGNVLAGNWKVALFVDDKASEAQEKAMLHVWTGKAGGPVAELVQLVGEVVAVERAPIIYELKEGKGALRIGNVVDTEMEPYRGPTGAVTTLNESIFTTIPGAPAWVAKASHYKRNSKQYGLMNIDLEGHNAIQGNFRFEHN